MTDHERAIDLITRQGVEEIAVTDSAWLEAHLATCSDCAEYAEACENTGRLLRAVAVTASPALVMTSARLRPGAPQAAQTPVATTTWPARLAPPLP